MSLTSNALRGNTLTFFDLLFYVVCNSKNILSCLLTVFLVFAFAFIIHHSFIINWSSLDLGRKYLCLLQLYKIIHGYSGIDYTAYVDLTGPTRTRSNHDFKIRPQAARTNYFKFLFFKRYVNDWNSLPNSVMSASSLSSFQTLLLDYLCK